MGIKEYEMMLDSLQMIGVYVIREDNHEVLYYNKRVKEVAPDIRRGMICHEIWKGICSNCPLTHIEDRKEARSVNYDTPFGKAVEITATRLLWEDRIPAFMIAVTPYAEVANYAYYKVLQGNLTTDTFNVVKAEEREIQDMKGYLSSLSKWFEGVVKNGYIYEEDAERYQKFVQIERLREALKSEGKTLNCIYRRRSGTRFKWHTLEIVPDFDYTDENQKVMIYVKDVHDLFRDGLEREEVNIRNQEIINSLGEMNFGIYVIDLQSGGVNMVRTTPTVRSIMKHDIFLWEDMLSGMEKLYIAADDQHEFRSLYSLDAMRQAWENGEKKRTFVYRGLLHEEWHYIRVSAFFKDRKKPGGYVILAFQDVDEQAREEMERTQNDRRMAAIIKSRYSIMNTVDLETGICERIYLGEESPGRRLEGDYDYYIRKALEESVAKEDKEKFRETFLLENLRKNAEEVQDFREIICRYRHRGKPVLWLEEHVLYIRQGKKTTVNILGRDITAEKLAEEHARRDLQEKAAIINSLSSMFFATYYVNLEKDLFRAVMQKEEVGNILGDERSYSQGIQMYARNFVHPDDRESFLENMNYENLLRTLSREHSLIAFEYRMVPGADARRAWTRATVVLSETAEDGRPKRALYVAQDVTEIKLKEEREQQALREACEAANHANAAKSDFMSRMSHDIRTPMNAIIGMTAIAGRYLEDKERVADCLGKITISSRHLLSLINEVLDMSKIESGKIDLVEEEINLSDLIGNLVTMIRPSMEEKGHNLNVRIVNVEHEHVIGDSMRMQQIFMNILGNAVKYTPPGGDIEMEIHEKRSHTFGYGCYEFIFRDNGIGMSREFQERLFEPFSRAEDSRVSKIEGTGLGMTIAKNIARRMNGDISVESECGKGTKFEVTLVLKHLNAELPDTEKLVDLPVLVVDDDEAASEMTCLILENIGMKGEYVLSGREALERVWERHEADEDYFAVILDWKMPDMDGIETAQEIRKKVGPDVPIIILSAYDWSGVEEEARRAGVNGFISKPLFKSRLIYLFNQIAGNDKNQEPPKPEKLIGRIPAGKRILLAEDNDLNREIAEEILGQIGVIVESVENGREALERFRESGENDYDMIFMDIQMPVMNGYEATAAIRKLPRGDASGIPIIAMTANAFAEDIIDSKNAGMNEHLTKPLDIEQLMRCLERWLGEKEK